MEIKLSRSLKKKSKFPINIRKGIPITLVIREMQAETVRLLYIR